MAVVHCVRTFGHDRAPVGRNDEIAVALRLGPRRRRRRCGGRLRRHGYLGGNLRRCFARLRRVCRTRRRRHGCVARQRVPRLFIALPRERHDAENQKADKDKRKEQKRRMNAVFPDARQTEGKALAAVIGRRAARRRAAGRASRSGALCRAANGAGAVVIPVRTLGSRVRARRRFPLRETPAVKGIAFRFRRLRRGAVAAGRIRLAVAAVAAAVGIVPLLRLRRSAVGISLRLCGVIIRIGLPRLRCRAVSLSLRLYRAPIGVGLRLRGRGAAVSLCALLQIAAAESIPRYFRKGRASSAVRLLPLLRLAAAIAVIVRIPLCRAALRRIRHGARRCPRRFGGGAGAAAVCGLGLAILGRRAAGVRRAAHAVERQLGKKCALALGCSAFLLRRARRAVSSIIAGFAVFHVERYLRTIIQRYYSEFCLSMQVKKVFRFPCAAALGVV